MKRKKIQPNWIGTFKIQRPLFTNEGQSILIYPVRNDGSEIDGVTMHQFFEEDDPSFYKDLLENTFGDTDYHKVYYKAKVIKGLIQLNEEDIEPTLKELWI